MLWRNSILVHNTLGVKLNKNKYKTHTLDYSHQPKTLSPLFYHLYPLKIVAFLVSQFNGNPHITTRGVI